MSTEVARDTPRLAAQPPAPSPQRLGLYLHIPFCQAICHYCNFSRGLLDERLKARYVDALEREIAREGVGTAADTIYFGGGTPSLLDPPEVARLLTACRHAFAMARDAEVTMEVNPESASAERFSGYRAVGVTRVSLGVQSLRDEDLGRLGRLHTASRARDAVRAARRAGFDNVSIDVMMALPQQRLCDWLSSLEGVLELAPDHVSLYLLELYPNAPLRDAMARHGWSLPADDEAAEMYLSALERLDEAGYEHYEISNAARPGRRSRHNLKYWTDGEWIGFGTAAHSTRGDNRWRNITAVSDYLDRIRDGRSVTAERRRLAAAERTGDALITGLRLVEGVRLSSLRGRYGIDVLEGYGPALEPFRAAGLLVCESDRLRLTREGMLVSNEVLRVFV